ncbi:MAG: hypothetical protein DME49_08930 [Verrucomicrobia bacterium]|nr:MAG: hypothetical protein DME49_08930 [Verrucomicrobiota bacterium]PYK92717.1 MAG: hypothetical protein DME36_12380 [Verrucomicrobiota bacterium]PYL40024.1 MAG: hypothetical protein DMF34_02570 [Verrucomicrobiota bacterium]PYL57145.1 MAG: hypothetical protein DMF30_07375 [Verrucomicrobiota bacterium]
MKRLSILSLIACALIMGGCADPLEQRSTQEVEGQFKRGISGQGQLVPNESTNNPTGAPSASETPPNYPPPP